MNKDTEFSKEKMSKQVAKLFSKVDEDSAIIMCVANGSNLGEFEYGNPFVLGGAIQHLTDEMREQIEKMPKDEAAPLMMDALMKGLKGLQDD